MRRDVWLAATAVFAISFTAYLLTMPPGLTYAYFGVDGGELITASTTLGIAHPPGYPLYILIGKLFSLIPIGSVAYRFNLLSAVAMAGSAVLLCVTAVYLQRSNKDFLSQSHRDTEKKGLPLRLRASALRFDELITAVTAALTYAFAPLIWQQAIIAEVYALLMLFLTLTLLLVVKKASPFWIGVAWGLAIVSHLTAVLLFPIILLMLGLRQRWWLLPIGVGVGLTPFLMLPLLFMTDSPIVWGDPTTLPGFMAYITAALYRDLPFRWPLDLWGARLGVWGPLFIQQLTLAGLPLLIFSYFQLQTQEQKRRWGVGGVTAVLFLLYAFLYNNGDAIVFTLPAILLLVLLLLPGLERLKIWGMLLPITLILLNFDRININQDRSVPQQVEQLLGVVPPNGVLESSGEANLFSLWYSHHVERERPDVLIVDSQLYVFLWYRERLKKSEPTVTEVPTDLAQFRQLQSAKRPYCRIVTRLTNASTGLSLTEKVACERPK